MRSFLWLTTAIDMPPQRAVQLASTSLSKSPLYRLTMFAYAGPYGKLVWKGEI